MFTMTRVIRMRALALSLTLWMVYLLAMTLNRAFTMPTGRGDHMRMQMDLPQLETTRSDYLFVDIGEHEHASDLKSNDVVNVEESRSVQAGVSHVVEGTNDIGEVESVQVEQHPESK